MMWFKTTLAMLCLSICFTASASLDETINYIDNLLAEGKKVAVLLIDMQRSYLSAFHPEYSETLIGYQKSLLINLAPKENVLFVNVSISTGSLSEKGRQTLPELQMQLNRKEYLQFFKSSDDVFDELPIVADQKDMKGVITGKLGDHLKSEGVTDIIPTGCFDGFCILDTAEGALKEGFHVHVDRDINIAHYKYWHGEASREQVLKDNTPEWQALKEKYPNLQIISEKDKVPC